MLKHKKGNIYKSIFENEKIKINKNIKIVKIKKNIYKSIFKNHWNIKRGNIYKSIFKLSKIKNHWNTKKYL